MLEAITISERRPSALRSLFRKAFGSRVSKQNFVRPLSQELDPDFPCPCCGKVLSIPASQAGKKARCRHCYQPIRNADPEAGKPALDLSQELDPISHPQDYPLCGHRATVVDYIPRGALAAMPLLVLVAVGVSLIGLLPKGDAKLGLVAAAHGPTPIEILTSPALEAEALVERFLNTRDWTKSVAHVFDGLSVADEIAALSQHRPAGDFKTSSRINDDGTSTVRVNFSDGTYTHFKVANIDGEDLIMWDSNPTRVPNEIHSRMVGMPEMEPE